ncbi:RCC1 domain-containing protein [Anaerosphaera multitolerans]|uniref:Uncharacterized protein n=1 Tax=Anaerosphaera multitolerans TaxID=2487351 RepID=A0A437S553_9FIRM|nr:hypothetical protein [Anaerosphaera multitolerans]RVU54139.1 hypothetical protein EF514_09145 [Anaerosphaera multitolerans]
MEKNKILSLFLAVIMFSNLITPIYGAGFDKVEEDDTSASIFFSEAELGKGSFTAKDIIDRYYNYEPAKGPINAPQYEQLSIVKFIETSTGYLSGMALDVNGKVWTWGRNSCGVQGLGEGVLTSGDASGEWLGGMKRIPYFVDNNITIRNIQSAYYTAYALSDKDELYAWGRGLEGQMGDGTNKYHNNSVHKVNIPNVKMFSAGQGAGANHAIAVDRNDDVWMWGYGSGNAIPGHSGYNSNPIKLKKLDLGVDGSGNPVTIVDVKASESANFILDSAGNVWAWGNASHGQLGNSSTTEDIDVPTKMGSALFRNKKIVQISAAGYRIMALAEDGTVYQWGDLEGSDLKTDDQRKPSVLEIDSVEIENIGYTPIPQKIIAGRRTAYFIDQHGRSWAWGNAIYFNLGREGGYEDSNDLTKIPKAQQYPNIVGDGDTQIYDHSPKFPKYATDVNSKGRHSRYGGYSFNNLHPTVYDEKYMLKNDAGDPIDYEGNALEYKTSGINKDKYVVKGTETVSIPEIDPKEAWINLSFKPMGYVQDISTYLSATTFLDSAGNIFKTALDGSGTIAWGWDFNEKYDLNGGVNSRGTDQGLYDRYVYEIVFMRGMPTKIPPTVNVQEVEKKKIYKEYDEKGNAIHDPVKVISEATVPETIVDEGLNLTAKAELEKVDYVFVPYDLENPDAVNLDISAIDTRIKDVNGNESIIQNDFDKLVEKGYKHEVLRTADKEVAGGTTLTDEIEVKENGILFVRSVFNQYGSPNGKVTPIVIDNFYTKAPIVHNGVGDALEYEGNGGQEEMPVYSNTSDNVVKTNEDSEDTKLDPEESEKLMGFPLDANGKVINSRPTPGGNSVIKDVAPTFGYDTVEVSSYEADKFEVDGWDLLDLNTKEPTDKVQKYPTITLDDEQSFTIDKEGNIEEVEYTFYYKANPNVLSKVEAEFIDVVGDDSTQMDEHYGYVKLTNPNGKPGRFYVFDKEYSEKPSEGKKPIDALNSSNLIGVFESDENGELHTKLSNVLYEALAEVYGGIGDGKIKRNDTHEEGFYPIEVLFQEGPITEGMDFGPGQKLLSNPDVAEVNNRVIKERTWIKLDYLDEEVIMFYTDPGSTVKVFADGKEEAIGTLQEVPDKDIQYIIFDEPQTSGTKITIVSRAPDKSEYRMSEIIK